MPCAAATSAFQYVIPSQPQTALSGPFGLSGLLTHVPLAAAQPETLQYSSDLQSFAPGLQPESPPSGTPLVPEVPLVPELPDVPLVPELLVPLVPELLVPELPPLVPDDEGVFVPELAVPPPKSSVSVAPPHEAEQATNTNATEPSNEVSRTRASSSEFNRSTYRGAPSFAKDDARDERPPSW
jgi:hypothetical protein